MCGVKAGDPTELLELKLLNKLMPPPHPQLPLTRDMGLDLLYS